MKLILIVLMLLPGCLYNTNKEKHFFLEYGQTGYVHAPTVKKNTWTTIEIKAPELSEVE